MSRLMVFAALIALGTAPLARAAEQRVALVIGNGAYRHVGQLANPANDARLIAATLHDLGFRLIGDAAQIDLDKSHMEQALARLGASVGPGDTALVYYAGHGVQIDGVNELVPVDAAPATAADIARQSVAADRAIAAMVKGGADVKLLILDACRDNPFDDMAPAAPGRGIRPVTVPGAATAHPGLALMRAPRGTVISFATQPGSLALDGAAKDSPYTLALAHALRRPDLDLANMFNQVGLDVNKATDDKQDPWLAISALGRDVFLGRAPSDATSSVATSVPATVMMHKSSVPPGALASAGRSCPAAGVTALRNGSVAVQYGGESAPGICLQTVAGDAQARGFGIWPANWDGAARAAAALTEVLAGPAGTSSSFTVTSEVHRLRSTTSEGWRITLTNTGPGQLSVGGRSHPVRLVHWEERNLGQVYAAEADIALDTATGAVLKQAFRVTRGDIGNSFDFWAKSGGGVGAAGSFVVTALN